MNIRIHTYVHACMHAWRWIVLVLARQHQGRAHTYIYTCMYVCIYMHMHTFMHIHTHTETYLYFTYHIHTPQALMYIYVYTFVYVCVCFCNIIEYTRQGYIHACYMCMTMSSCMYMPLPCLWERHPRRATGAAPPCPPGPLHWPCVKPSAYSSH